MKRKKSIGSIIFDVFNYVFMCFIIIVMLYPMLYVVAISLSDNSYIMKGQVTWFPRGFNLLGYEMIMKKVELWITYKNTIIYAITGTIIMLLFTSLLAYALSIKEFMFKKFITIFLTITMFFGGGLIPTFLLIKNLKMLDTFWVMIIPGCVSAFNVIIFRTFFQGLPNELRESAYIDGANDITILFRIILPLSKALLAVFALFSIVGHWNNWFSALIYLRDSNKWPLQMFLRQIVIIEDMGNSFGENDISYYISKRMLNPKNIQNAAIVITMLPIVCIYPFVQKYFVKGVMVGTIKG